MNSIHLKITELRKEKGISQRELADHLGVSFQSVSKWETGVTMPDITLLPILSEYFEVSVDELLGLKPLTNRDYIRSRTDTKEFWKDKIDYLKKNKILFWNDDYLEFLVHSVWNIDHPVNIIDFGCGFGILGSKLLPLLPDGSTYTGIDINERLLEAADEHFNNTTYRTKFITCDLYDYIPDQKYDIAICQAVLRHLSHPKEVLKKMIDSVVDNGLVICIEVNREFENVGLYIDGMDYNYLCTGFDYHKLWRTELEKQGRDYATGIRIPFYMQEYGLKDIDVRVNDRALLIHPQQENYEELMHDFMAIYDLLKIPTEKEKEGVISFHMNRGMTRIEAEAYVKKKMDITYYLSEHKEDASLIMILGLLVTYGRKR